MNQHPQNYKYAKLQVAPDLKNENARLRGLAHGPGVVSNINVRARFTNKVKSIIMSLNFSSSQLARISSAEFVLAYSA